MTRRLSFADVLAVVEKVPDLSGIVLVGGQALNFWAETLGIATADAAGVYGPALSDDIDFLGSARAALAFGAATGGKVDVAGWESAHSPNTALVTLDIDGESHLIDFLSSMKGFSPEELERVRANIARRELLRRSAEGSRRRPKNKGLHAWTFERLKEDQ